MSVPTALVVLDPAGRLELVRLVVFGMPGPQGSKKAVGFRKSKITGRTVTVMAESSEKVKPWREAVVWAAREVLTLHGDPAPLDGPLVYRMTFTLPKPGSAPTRKPSWPCRKPDGSKLLRSTEDALTDAGLWADDARAVLGTFAKVYPGEGLRALPAPGAVIEVATLVAGNRLFGIG
jgi:crossover junction endodeoxyribonuclease RusA